MKKARNPSSAMNYFPGRGGGGGGGGREETTGDRDGLRGRYNPPIDYHNYPTAPRDYPLTSANANYRNDPPSYRNKSGEYRNEAEFHNKAPAYRHEPPSYRNEPPSYRNDTREMADGPRGYTSDRRALENGYQTSKDYGSLSRHPPPSYNHHYTHSGEYSTAPRSDYRGSSQIDGLAGDRCNVNTRERYFKTAEDYHHAYRGGYRPAIVDTDGYTTDGSGSGYRDGSGSGRGFENFRYPESEALLPGGRYLEGNTYPRGEILCFFVCSFVVVFLLCFFVLIFFSFFFFLL